MHVAEQCSTLKSKHYNCRVLVENYTNNICQTSPPNACRQRHRPSEKAQIAQHCNGFVTTYGKQLSRLQPTKETFALLCTTLPSVNEPNIVTVVYRYQNNLSPVQCLHAILFRPRGGQCPRLVSIRYSRLRSAISTGDSSKQLLFHFPALLYPVSFSLDDGSNLILSDCQQIWVAGDVFKNVLAISSQHETEYGCSLTAKSDCVIKLINKACVCLFTSRSRALEHPPAREPLRLPKMHFWSEKLTSPSTSFSIKNH